MGRRHRGWLAATVALLAMVAAPWPALAEPPGAAPTPSPPADLDQALRDIDALVDVQQSRHGFPSLVIGIVQGPRLIYRRAHGHAGACCTRSGRSVPARDRGLVDENTVFRVGSITKLFTVLAMLRLVDAGRVSLADPVARHLPEITRLAGYARTGGPSMRVSHLLAHTSGLPRNYPGHPRTDPTEAELLALGSLELQSAPGTRTSYSNLGLALAGILVERLGRSPFGVQLREHLLGPLSMTSSDVDPARIPGSRLAAGHTRTEELAVLQDGLAYRVAEDAQRDHSRAAAPAGGLYASLADLARFASFALREPPSRLRVAWQRFPPFVQLRALRRRAVGHSGVVSGYSAEMWLLPERDLAVIGLMGSGFGSADPQRLTELVGTVLDRLARKGEGPR